MQRREPLSERFRNCPHRLTSITSAPMKPFNPEAIFGGRVVEMALFQMGTEKKPPADLQALQTIIDELKTRSADFDGSGAEVMVLGPEQIDAYAKIRKCLGETRLVSSHKYPLSVLVIEKKMEAAVKRELEHKTSETLLLPQHSIMMSWSENERPGLVRSAAATSVALCKDDLPAGEVPEDYYSRLLNYDIVASRLLTDPEKLGLEMRTGNANLLGNQIRLLEFHNAIDRNGAAATQHVEWINEIYNNSEMYATPAELEECQIVVNFITCGLSDKCAYRILHLALDRTKPGRFDPAVIRTGALPMAVTKLRDCVYRVDFEQARAGERAIDLLLNGERYMFYTQKKGLLRPKMMPTYRMFMRCHRDVRAINDAVLHTFIGAELGNRRGHYTNKEYVRARFFEEWNDGEEMGLIGVEGWSPAELRTRFAELKELLAATSFECRETHPELLFGIGEAFARKVAAHFDVLIDVDKFKGVISMFGRNEKIHEAFEEMKKFATHKEYLEVDVDIPADPLLTAEDVERIGDSLNVTCRLVDGNIQFRGPLLTYKTLVSTLDEVENAAFERLSSQGKISNEGCPVCFVDDIGGEDYFRQTCGHSICRQCCNLKVTTAISTSNFQTYCDNENCEKKWSPKDYLRAILGDDRRIRALDGQKLADLRAASKWHILSNDADAIACSTASCKGLLVRKRGEPKVRCPDCEYVYCGDCFADSHAPLTCEELERHTVDKEMVLMMQRNLVRVCPHCDRYTWREYGCHHMTCKCENHFCWLCGAAAKSIADCNKHLVDVHGKIGPIEIPEFDDFPELDGDDAEFDSDE